MVNRLFQGGRHMAGGAGWRSAVIYSEDPGIGIEIHLILRGIEFDAMLGLVENLNLGMIRPHVTAAAIFRTPGLGRGERMPQVTRRA